MNTDRLNPSDIASRLHPDLQAAFQHSPRILMDRTNVEENRALSDAIVKQMVDATAPDDHLVRIEDLQIPGLDGEPEVTVTIYKPLTVEEGKKIPAIIDIHGGGLVTGNGHMLQPMDCNFCLAVGALVISPDYRLSPEHVYPAALNDCYAALIWINRYADEWNVDRDKIFVTGASAGACLAIGMTIKARDENGPKIAAQSIQCPMLDYRNCTPSSYEVTDTRSWSRQQNINSWEMYLGENHAEPVPPTASPAMLKDFHDLPPAWFSMGQVDLFRDECIDYARKLMAEGIDVELHIYPGLNHGGEGLAPMSSYIQRISSVLFTVMKRFADTGHF